MRADTSGHGWFLVVLVVVVVVAMVTGCSSDKEPATSSKPASTPNPPPPPPPPNPEKEKLKNNPAPVTWNGNAVESYAKESDASVIARLLYGEDINSIDGHLWVIENRRNGDNTYRNVVLAKGQWHAMWSERALDPSSKLNGYGEQIAWDKCVDAAYDFLENGPNPSAEHSHIYTQAYFDGVENKRPNGIHSGNTWFYTK